MVPTAKVEPLMMWATGKKSNLDDPPLWLHPHRTHRRHCGGGLGASSFAAGLRGLDDAKSREAAGKGRSRNPDSLRPSGSLRLRPQTLFRSGSTSHALRSRSRGSFSLLAVPLEVDGRKAARGSEKAENEEEGYLSALHESARQELERLRAGPSWSPAESELGEGIDVIHRSRSSPSGRMITRAW